MRDAVAIFCQCCPAGFKGAPCPPYAGFSGTFCKSRGWFCWPVCLGFWGRRKVSWGRGCLRSARPLPRTPDLDTTSRKPRFWGLTALHVNSLKNRVALRLANVLCHQAFQCLLEKAWAMPSGTIWSQILCFRVLIHDKNKQHRFIPSIWVSAISEDTAKFDGQISVRMKMGSVFHLSY